MTAEQLAEVDSRVGRRVPCPRQSLAAPSVT